MLRRRNRTSSISIWILFSIGIVTGIGYLISIGVNLQPLSYFEGGYGNFGFRAGNVSEQTAFSLGVISILSFVGMGIIRLFLQNRRRR